MSPETGEAETPGDPARDPAAAMPRRHRRAHLEAPAGTDVRPGDHPLTSRTREDKPEGWGEAAPSSHDDELRRDRPPHWR